MGPPTNAMAMGGRPGSATGNVLPLAPYAARALGSMGEADLLRGALNAVNHSNFDESPTEVQRAALAGIAHLPADQDPLGLLVELLGLANTTELRRAAGSALVSALKLSAT